MKDPSGVQTSYTRLVGGTRKGKCRFEPSQPLVDMAARLPERSRSTRKFERKLTFAGADGPIERRPQVRVFAIEV